MITNYGWQVFIHSHILTHSQYKWKQQQQKMRWRERERETNFTGKCLMMWNSMVWLLIEWDGAENWNWIFKIDYNDDDSVINQGNSFFFWVCCFKGYLRMDEWRNSLRWK